MTRAERIDFFKRTFRVFVIAALLIFPACSEDDPQAGNKYVNTWILNNMRLFYLWYDEIPSSPNKSKDPETFFNSLLSNQDRFSWIQDSYIELLNSLRGVTKEAGYDFVLYPETAGSENLIGKIMYIKKGSLIETEHKDLQRGDEFTHINGTRITRSNISDLYAETSRAHTLQYSRPDGENLIDKGTIPLNTAEFAENPNFMDKIIEVDDKRIGYYVYNFFATSRTATGNQYDAEMDAVFGRFKAGNITDLIIDLRFNSGGAESATINLASLIGKGVDDTKVFSRNKYNPQFENELVARYGTGYLIKNFTNKTQNVGSLLSNGKVYILTSFRTASASELLINGLKPYMDVFLIGDETVGKNVGSVSIFNSNDPRNTWAMQPIVLRSYNSLYQSDYADGFQPNILNKDDNREILPIGDEGETLLSLAIDEITGNSSARKNLSERKYADALGSSTDFKRGGYNLLIDDKRLQDFFSQLPTEQ